MTNFKEAVEAIVKNNGEPEWLKGLRLQALGQFEKVSGPQRTDEEWRRIDVNKILFSDLRIQTEKLFFDEQDKLIGSDSLELSDPIFQLRSKEGIIFDSITEAALKHPQIVGPYLEDSQKNNHKKFHAFSNALWNGGVFLYVPKNMSIRFPVTWFYYRKLLGADLEISNLLQAFLPKTIIVMEEGSSLTFIADEFSRISETGDWVYGDTEVYLKPNAHLSYMRMQRMNRKTTTLSSFRAVLEKNASLNLLAVELGSALTKSNWDAELAGEGSHVRAFGLTKGEGTQHFDQTVFISHQVPNTQSNVLFKTAMKDKSRSMFSGLIHVWKAAQKTNAYQTSRNLLLSREARADAIPKLEIEADDVKCGHGATVSSVDEDQLYYLMSRGLSRGESEDMIIEGFYGDVLDQSDILGEWLKFMKEKQVLPEEKAEVLYWIRKVLFASNPQSSCASLLR